jgi:hypothetical protein
MKNITILFTKHRESGKCNSVELVKIFDKIQPDIIFEEISPDRYDAYYKDNEVSSLETNAVKEYISKNNIKHIPVDKNYDMEEIKRQFDNFTYLSKLFFDNSSEYCYIWENILKMTETNGFEYFNSENFTNHTKVLHFFENDMINFFKNEAIINRYNLWLNNLNERENEMINNIYNFSKENEYKQAIFCIGAEHKLSLIEKLSKINNNIINWIYNIF